MTHAISFEFFPPKTDQGAAKLATVQQRLATLYPDFFSVTYGAGGSTRERTLAAVDHIAATGAIVAPHLSCIGDSREQITTLLDRYQTQGITRLVALRGDLPSGQATRGELPFASDLVHLIRQHSGDHFHIEVAAYPEMHPQAETLQQDIDHFCQKVQAGANSAITQYFFNADSYFYFVDQVQKRHIDIPIVPGIMPITNASNLIRFSDACGAEIPRWIRKQLLALGDNSDAIAQFGLDMVGELCQKLLAGGAPGLHFYTMNQDEPSYQLVSQLGLTGAV